MSTHCGVTLPTDPDFIARAYRRDSSFTDSSLAGLPKRRWCI